MNNQIEMTQSLESSLMNLVGSMKRSRLMAAYLEIKKSFDADGDAQNIIADLNAVQAEIRQNQYNGQIKPQDLKKLRNLQTSAQENDTIMAFVQAQQEAGGFMREVNLELSQLLGMDFASLAKNTSC